MSEEFKTDIIYKIEETNDYMGKGMQIKSNLTDDDLQSCKISKSLVDYLLKNSATLEPDKLLITFAEAQKRQLELELENLDDLTLSAKAKADDFFNKRSELENSYEEKFAEFEKSCSSASEKVHSRLERDSNAINSQIEKMEGLSKKIRNIDDYKLEQISKSISLLLDLINKDEKLVKLVLENYTK